MEEGQFNRESLMQPLGCPQHSATFRGVAVQASNQIKVAWRPVSPSRRWEKYLSAAA